MREQIRAKVFACIEKNRLIEAGDTICAAVSGGADSVCLLLLLRSYRERVPFTLQVIHVEHGIRGEESLADAQFVRRLCEQMQVELTVRTVDAPAVAAAQKLSLEEAARNCRYEAFSSWLGSAGAHAKVALAHNAEDQAETVLFHLSRGSGLQGLAGMRPVRNGFIRPLLQIRRAEIEDFVSLSGLSWRTDSTNLSEDYTRNRIRSRILPQLETSVNAQTVRHIGEAAEALAQVQDYLRTMAVQDLKDSRAESSQEHIGCRLCLRTAAILSLPPVRQEYLLREALERVGDGYGLQDVGRVHIRALTDLAGKSGNRHLDLPGGRQADVQGGLLILSAGGRKPAAAPHIAPLEITTDTDGVYETGGYVFSVSFMSGAQLEASGVDYREQNPYTKWLACDTIRDTLCLRTRRPGDWMVINREGGRRSLKKYLIDEKVPRDARDTQILLADGPCVWWAVGHRIGENAKITPQTQRVMQISCRPARTSGEGC